MFMNNYLQGLLELIKQVLLLLLLHYIKYTLFLDNIAY